MKKSKRKVGKKSGKSQSTSDETESAPDVKDLWGDPKDPEYRAIETEFARVRAGINWLAKRAHGGDKIAHRRLVTLIVHGTNAVRALMSVCFESTREIAMGETCWPVNITDSSEFPENLDALRRRLNIGAHFPVGFNLRVPLNHKSKTKCREVVAYSLLTIQAARAFERKKKETCRFVTLTRMLDAELRSEDTPQQGRREKEIHSHATRALANRLHKEIEPMGRTALRHLATLLKILSIEDPTGSVKSQALFFLSHDADLPDLSIESKQEWFFSVEGLLLALTNDAPSENLVLREIGRYREKKYFRDLGISEDKIDAHLKSERAKSTVNTNIRDGIFTKIRAMVSSLLRPVANAEKSSPFKKKKLEG